MLPSIMVVEIVKAPVINGQPSADSVQFLLWPDAAGEWTIGGWDGAAWYDYAGVLISPRLWALLPLGAVVLGALT